MSLAKTKHIEQPTVLYMDGVSVSFDGFKALNSLSLLSNQEKCAQLSARTVPVKLP